MEVAYTRSYDFSVLTSRAAWLNVGLVNVEVAFHNQEVHS